MLDNVIDKWDKKMDWIRLNIKSFCNNFCKKLNTVHKFITEKMSGAKSTTKTKKFLIEKSQNH